jgi:NaMN:DMB phosphoribosyltransferase
MKLAWRHDVHLIIGEGIPAGTGLASAAVTRGLGGGNEAIA